MDDLVKLRISVKKEYLTMVANMLETDVLTLESVREPTRQFKIATSADSVESLKINIKSFCDQFPEFFNLNSFLLSTADNLQIDQLKAKMETMIGSSPVKNAS